MTRFRQDPKVVARLADESESLTLEGQTINKLGNLGVSNGAFEAPGGVIDVSTRSELPASNPPQLAYIQNEDLYLKDSQQGGETLTGATFVSSISAAGGQPTGVEFSPDGTKLFQVTDADGVVAQSSLSTPFDISTATLDKSLVSQFRNASDIRFAPSGDRYFECDRREFLISQVNLGTSFDIGTETSSQTLSLGFPVFGLDFAEGGKKMYMTDPSNDDLLRARLTTAFDITTATIDETVASQDAQPKGLAISSDGERVFEVGANAGLIYESELQTPFSLSNQSLIQTISTQDGDPGGIAFGPDTFIEAGENAASIFQSSIDTSPGFDIL